MTINKLVSIFAAMYFKVSIRTNPATGDPDGYYRLIESYRNADDRVCHRTLLNVGFMGEVAPEELNRIQKMLNHKCKHTDNELFQVEYDKESPLVRKWFDELYRRLVSEKKIDVSELPPARRNPSSGCDWETIDMNTLRHKEVREIGAKWLCYQSLKQLDLERFFLPGLIGRVMTLVWRSPISLAVQCIRLRS